MSFFVNVLALAVPVFTLQVYDRVVAHQGTVTLVGLAIGMAVIVVFDFILRQARSRIMQTVALRVDAVVGRQIFNKFTSLPLNVLEARPGSFWQGLFRDVDVVRNTLSGASAILVCDLPFAILFFGVIWVIAEPIAWVLLVITPIFLFVTYRAGAATGKASSEERFTMQDRDNLIGEMIQGRATIKALALEGSMRPMWEERHAHNIESAIARGGRTDFFSNLGQSLTMTTSVVMTSVGVLAIIDQAITMGSLIATNMLAGRLLGPLNQLVNQWRNFTSFKQSVERLGEVFNMASERQESEVELDKPTGRIECHAVTFAYAEGIPPVCDNVTVSFHAGGIHALVGRNGSGKTTLLKILQGLYVPSTGRVLLDGADISQFSRRELAQWMGYVPQESTLFAGTVRENIIHRFPSASDEQIIRAAKAAGVHEFIIDMPDGYGTEIGEAGQRLSGGQRQRIAIARALIGDPAVLLLDEPSSSLDRHAEHELRDTLKELAKRHTVIIVTHSPILLAACDNLVALDKGKVALAGPASDILPRLFGGGAKTQALAAAAGSAAPEADGGAGTGPGGTADATQPGVSGQKPQVSERPTGNAGEPAGTRPTEARTAAQPAGKPLAAPKLGGGAPSAKPVSRDASRQGPKRAEAPAKAKGGVKPVARQAAQKPPSQAPSESAPQPRPETKPAPAGATDAAATASAAGSAAATGAVPAADSAPGLPSKTRAERPSGPPPQTAPPKTQPAQDSQAGQAGQAGQSAQSDEAAKRPTAQASPPPESQQAGKIDRDAPASDDDDPYTAALRDMIRSDH